MLKRAAVTIAMALCFARLAQAQPTGTAHAPSTDALPQIGPSPTAPTAVQPSTILPCDCPAPTCSQDQWWGSADYILGWVRAASVPPLVTTSPAGTAQGMAGVVGQGNTSVLFGDSKLTGDVRSGFRLDLGRWIDCEHTLGVDAGVFLLESDAALFFANSPTASPILARPFINATTNAATSQLIAFPGVATGSVTASYRNDNFIGANIDFEECVPLCCGIRLRPMLGYRYLQFNDRLAVDTNETAAAGGPFAAGTQINVSDRFSTVNVFHGGDFGLRTEYCFDGLCISLLTKLAVGGVHRSIGIAGTTHINVPGSPAADFNGGLLALSSNSGVFSSADFVVAPEFGVSLGWEVSKNLQLRLGYSFLLWSEVARAGDQVDVNINPNLIPPPQGSATPNVPASPLKKSDIWVQSLSLGAEFKF
jgi:hypothetical protein